MIVYLVQTAFLWAWYLGMLKSKTPVNMQTRLNLCGLIRTGDRESKRQREDLSCSFSFISPLIYNTFLNNNNKKKVKQLINQGMETNEWQQGKKKVQLWTKWGFSMDDIKKWLEKERHASREIGIKRQEAWWRTKLSCAKKTNSN